MCVCVYIHICRYIAEKLSRHCSYIHICYKNTMTDARDFSGVENVLQCVRGARVECVRYVRESFANCTRTMTMMMGFFRERKKIGGVH